MSFYKLTFKDGSSYTVRADQEKPAHFLKHLRQFVTSYTFVNDKYHVVYLEHPFKFEVVNEDKNAYENWDSSR